MSARFPGIDEDALLVRDEAVEGDMAHVFGVISGIRNIRSTMNIPPSMELGVNMQTQDAHERRIIEENHAMIENLARLNGLEVTDPGDAPPSSATAVVNGTSIYVSLMGVIDFAKEAARLEAEIAKVTKELVAVSKRLNNESFLEKAPEEVVDKVKTIQQGLEEKNDKLKENLERIHKIAG
jgi:valyl-tRNA synthetase